MIGQLIRLAKGREWQFNVITMTALVTTLLVLTASLQRWPLWAIALSAIVPWAPLFTTKVFWSSKHYGFMALFLVFVVLQLGHFGEHIAQMLQFITIVDPAAGCFGWSWNGPGCPQAHGVFGALDRELVHFVWDGLVLIAAVVIRLRFRRVKNIWLTIAVVAAAAHQVEHIFLFGMYLFNKSVYANGGAVLSQSLFICTIPDGSGVQAGLLGHNGVLATLTGRGGWLNALLPNRINLHFVYNSVVLAPMLLGFARQTRSIYDEWLAKALPKLSPQQLIAATARAEVVTFPAGAVIFRQGDPADRLYIISKGQVEVLRRERHTAETPVAHLAEGHFFGEIGVLGRTERTATVRAATNVECLALDQDLVKSMLAASAEAYKDVDVVLRRRLVQLGAVHGLALKEAVNEDPDTVLKTLMIRRRVRLLDSDDLSRFLSALLAETSFPAYARQGQGAGDATAAQRSGDPTGDGLLWGTLTVRGGPSAGLRFEIRAPRIVVGRRGANRARVPVMQIDDPCVSRMHIEIAALPDGIYVQDLGSANGTWIDGRKLGLDPVRLDGAAEIRLGSGSVLTYQPRVAGSSTTIPSAALLQRA